MNQGVVSPAPCAAIQYGISTTGPSTAEPTASATHHERRLNRPQSATANPAAVDQRQHLGHPPRAGSVQASASSARHGTDVDWSVELNNLLGTGLVEEPAGLAFHLPPPEEPNG